MSIGLVALFAVLAVGLAAAYRTDKLEARIDELYNLLDAMAEHVDFTMEDDNVSSR